jgi:glycosyltransferase involved in cell wall biosynthesis
MKVVQILPRLQEGGVERGVVELNREMVRRGIESHVISLGGSLVDQILKHGGGHTVLDVTRKNPFTAPLRVLRLRRELQGIKPDVVDVRSRVPAWLFLWANRSLHIPWVSSVHGFNSVNYYSSIMTRGDRVVCVSHPVADFIREQYSVDSSKIRVVHRGLDPESFQSELSSEEKISELRHELGIPTDGRIVLVSGRITRLKGIDTMLKALAVAKQKETNLYAVIVGGAAAKSKDLIGEYIQLTKDLRVEEKVRFVGSRGDLPIFYAMSDLLVSCSRKPESFGRSLLESMAMGTPVITPALGGALDIINENQNGLFYQANSHEDLANTILRGLQIEWDVSAIQKTATETFSLNRMIDGTLKVYEEIVPRK